MLTTTPDATGAITRLVAELEAGWNEHSGRRYAAPFAADADYVAINGMRASGREQITAAHDHLFATRFRNSRLRLTVEAVRALTDDVAIGHVLAHNTVSSDDATDEWDCMLTAVVQRSADGTWQIAAFQNTRVQPPPEEPR